MFLYKVLELAFSAEGGVTSLFGAAGEAMDSSTERVYILKTRKKKLYDENSRSRKEYEIKMLSFL